MRTISAFLAALLVLTVCAGFPRRPLDVSAGTALRLEPRQLAQRAALILEGRVLQARAVETQEMVETEYLVRVDRTHRGQDHAYRSIRLPGGVLPDGRGMMLAGVPRLGVGEDVLLFLSREGKGGIRMPIGLSQGKMRVVERPGHGKFLLQEPAGVSIIGPDGQVREGLDRRLLPYAQVVAEIEVALASERSR